MAKEKQTTEEPKAKVKLKHHHEHARVQYQAGDEIDVPASTAEYMQEKGIADPV